MFNNLFQKQKEINPWHFLWLAIVFSEIFTLILDTLLSLTFFGNISSDLLIIGAIGALIVPSIIAPPIIIYFIKHASRLRDINDQMIEEITERKRLEKELRTLSLTDELTHLYNRRGFFTLAEQQLKIARRRGRELLLLITDVDNLKRINDTFGHNEGDQALMETANILKENFREADIIGRIGGDEFAILQIPDTAKSYDNISARMQKMFDMHNTQKERSFNLSISLGIAHYDPDAPCTLDELLSRADKLMYEHKKHKGE